MVFVKVIVWAVVVFGDNNTASNILKYYEQVLLPNTRYSPYYYLFIMKANKFSAKHDHYFVPVEWTNMAIYIRIIFYVNVYIIDRFLYKASKIE